MLSLAYSQVETSLQELLKHYKKEVKELPESSIKLFKYRKFKNK
jgi:hypothetical protein